MKKSLRIKEPISLNEFMDIFSFLHIPTAWLDDDYDKPKHEKRINQWWGSQMVNNFKKVYP